VCYINCIFQLYIALKCVAVQVLQSRFGIFLINLSSNLMCAIPGVTARNFSVFISFYLLSDESLLRDLVRCQLVLHTLLGLKHPSSLSNQKVALFHDDRAAVHKGTFKFEIVYSKHTSSTHSLVIFLVMWLLPEYLAFASTACCQILGGLESIAACSWTIINNEK
jgi:hypothetical protein